MLQTIEVEIETNGRIHPLEPLPFIPAGRAYLTLLPASDERSKPSNVESGSAAQVLQLLASSRFAQRSIVSLNEVQQRINELCNDWGDH